MLFCLQYAMVAVVRRAAEEVRGLDGDIDKTWRRRQGIHMYNRAFPEDSQAQRRDWYRNRNPSVTLFLSRTQSSIQQWQKEPRFPIRFSGTQHRMEIYLCRDWFAADRVLGDTGTRNRLTRDGIKRTMVTFVCARSLSNTGSVFSRSKFWNSC